VQRPAGHVVLQHKRSGTTVWLALAGPLLVLEAVALCHGETAPRPSPSPPDGGALCVVRPPM